MDMKAVGKTAKTFDWLEEFDAPVDLNRTPELLAAYPNVKPEPPAGLYRLRRPRGYFNVIFTTRDIRSSWIPLAGANPRFGLKSQMPTRYE